MCWPQNGSNLPYDACHLATRQNSNSSSMDGPDHNNLRKKNISTSAVAVNLPSSVVTDRPSSLITGETNNARLLVRSVQINKAMQGLVWPGLAWQRQSLIEFVHIFAKTLSSFEGCWLICGWSEQVSANNSITG